MLGGVAPDLQVRRLGEPHVQNVLTLHTHTAQKACQRYRKLIVNEESHEASRTGWSAWWAAYSIAAKTSSRSRNA